MALRLFVRRRRSLLCKILVGIPVLWLTVMAVNSMTGNSSLGESNDLGRNPRANLGQPNIHADSEVKKPPVLENPDSENLRLQREAAKIAENAEKAKLEHERQIQAQEGENVLPKMPSKPYVDPNAPGQSTYLYPLLVF